MAPVLSLTLNIDPTDKAQIEEAIKQLQGMLDSPAEKPPLSKARWAQSSGWVYAKRFTKHRPWVRAFLQQLLDSNEEIDAIASEKSKRIRLEWRGKEPGVGYLWPSSGHLTLLGWDEPTDLDRIKLRDVAEGEKYHLATRLRDQKSVDQAVEYISNLGDPADWWENYS